MLKKLHVSSQSPLPSPSTPFVETVKGQPENTLVSLLQYVSQNHKMIMGNVESRRHPDRFRRSLSVPPRYRYNFFSRRNEAKLDLQSTEIVSPLSCEINSTSIDDGFFLPMLAELPTWFYRLPQIFHSREQRKSLRRDISRFIKYKICMHPGDDALESAFLEVTNY